MSNCGFCFLWPCSHSEELMNYVLQCIKMPLNAIKKQKKCVLMAENEMQMEVLFTPLCIRDRLDPEKT